MRSASGRKNGPAGTATWPATPEFLKEGAAINDFIKPDRVVVGVRRAQVADVPRQLYSPFLHMEKPFLIISPESAEMTKYVAKALLSTKISFVNEVANRYESMRAHISDVAPRHRARQPHRLCVLVSGRGLRPQLLSARRAGAGGASARVGNRVADSASRGSRQNASKDDYPHKNSKHFGGQLFRAHRRCLGPVVQASHR